MFMEPQLRKGEFVLYGEDDDSRFLPAEEYESDSGPERSRVSGWGVRLSAPGYLDCTSWSVYDTRIEALRALADEVDGEFEDSDEQAVNILVELFKEVRAHGIRERLAGRIESASRDEGEADDIYRDIVEYGGTDAVDECDEFEGSDVAITGEYNGGDI